MRLSLEDVRHVAELAKLRLDEAELEQYAGQLSAILEYAESIQQLGSYVGKYKFKQAQNLLDKMIEHLES